MAAFITRLLLIRLKQAGRALWSVGWLLILSLPMGGLLLLVLWDKLSSLPAWQLAPLTFVSIFSLHWQRKDLAFLGVLAQNRPILILDEPFNGLDLESSEKLSIILQELRKKGRTILIASHILETLTRNGDRISHLSDGRIRETYEAAEFPEMITRLRDQFRKDIADDLGRVL